MKYFKKLQKEILRQYKKIIMLNNINKINVYLFAVECEIQYNIMSELDSAIDFVDVSIEK